MVLDLRDKTELKIRQFQYREDITEVWLPEIDNIPEDCFDFCINLKTVHIPESVKTINRWAFYNCVSLENIDLPEKLERIGERAFYNCISLENINFPKTLESIGREAFINCVSLKAIKLSKKIQIIDSGAFKNCLKIKTLKIQGTPTFSPQCFGNLMKLQDIDINISREQILEIQKFIFFNCPNVSKLKINCEEIDLTECSKSPKSRKINDIILKHI